MPRAGSRLSMLFVGVTFLLGGIALHVWTIVLAHMHFGKAWQILLCYVPVWSILTMMWQAWQVGWWWYLVPAAMWVAVAAAFFALDKNPGSDPAA